MSAKTPEEIEEEKFGRFFGDRIGDAELDALVYQRLTHLSPEKLGRMERELYTTKWFDYRFMHFARATYLFAHLYSQIYKVMHRREIDAASALRVRPLPTDDFLRCGQQSLITSIWKARQSADRLGVPYEFYIEQAMDKAFTWTRSHVPRPNQLYSEEIVDTVEEWWKERCGSIFRQSKDPRYKFDDGPPFTHQLAHEQWVLAQAKSTSTIYSLHTALTKTRTVTREGITAAFGEEMLQRVLEHP